MIVVLAAIASSAVSLPQLLTSVPKLPPPPYNILGQDIESYEVSFHLNISPSGKVFRCETKSLMYASLVREDVCRKFKSAQLSPAKGRNGEAQYGILSLELRWPDRNTQRASPHVSDVDFTVERLPAGSSIHPRTQLVLTVGADGKVTSCDVEQSSGVAALDAVACKAETAAMVIHAESDEVGRPVASVQPLTVSFGAYTKVVAKRDDRYGPVGDAGPFYPKIPTAMITDGYANLACEADAQGHLKNCQVDEEDPVGCEFGSAAKRAAWERWIQVTPGVSGPVLVQLIFPKLTVVVRR